MKFKRRRKKRYYKKTKQRGGINIIKTLFKLPEYKRRAKREIARFKDTAAKLKHMSARKPVYNKYGDLRGYRQYKKTEKGGILDMVQKGLDMTKVGQNYIRSLPI